MGGFHLILLTTGVLLVWSAPAALARTPAASKEDSLLGLLVFVAAAVLLISGVYRLGLFNLDMGLHRWMYRALTYFALLRDDYPPVRLDQGPLDARRLAGANK